MKRNMVAGFVIVGLMLIGAGLSLGFVPVSVASGTSCGSAFSAADPAFDGLTDTGEQACTQLRTSHRPAAVALLVAGGIALLGAGLAAGVGGERTDAPVPLAESLRIRLGNGTDAPVEVPPEPPTMYGTKS